MADLLAQLIGHCDARLDALDVHAAQAAQDADFPVARLLQRHVAARASRTPRDGTSTRPPVLRCR